MKLESQVCSLELAKQLKELGVKQDSLFYWVITTEMVDDTRYVTRDMAIDAGDRSMEGSVYSNEQWEQSLDLLMANQFDKNNVDESYSAFTVAELYNLLYMHGIGDILLDGVKPEHLADYLGEKLCKAL